jgi:ABC-type transport system involved in multi-copper enzyme maturation permease subunit
MRPTLAVAGVVIKEMFRRKDFYVLFVLTAVISLMMGSINIFNDDKIARHIKELCLALIWGASLVISVICAARQIPAELESRTLFPLLAKPLGRSQFIAGKFLGCWAACGLALVCFYLFFGVLAASRERHWPLANYFQAMGMHWFMLGMVVALALAGSLVFAAASSNATICFSIIASILVLGRHLNHFAIQEAEPGRSILYALYFAIPHLELFDVRDLIIHDWPPVPWSACGLAGLYASAYTAILLAASCLLFRRKSLT